MKIKKLFEELKDHTAGKEKFFEDSGVVNRSNEMEYGFFPLGLGLLSEDLKKIDDNIEDNGIMILGNDFGTVKYVRENCQEGRGEEKGSTVVNLKTQKYGLADRKNVFFTNFYLGLRLDTGRYEKTTNVKRYFDGKINKPKGDYKDLCYKFFIKQLELTNPRVVICLGHEVKNALFENAKELFPGWTKSRSIKDLFKSNSYKYKVDFGGLGERTFMVIPHPCYNINYNKKHVDCVIEEIEKEVGDATAS